MSLTRRDFAGRSALTGAGIVLAGSVGALATTPNALASTDTESVGRTASRRTGTAESATDRWSRTRRACSRCPPDSPTASSPTAAVPSWTRVTHRPPRRHLHLRRAARRHSPRQQPRAQGPPRRLEAPRAAHRGPGLRPGRVRRLHGRRGAPRQGRRVGRRRGHLHQLRGRQHALGHLAHLRGDRGQGRPERHDQGPRLRLRGRPRRPPPQPEPQADQGTRPVRPRGRRRRPQAGAASPRRGTPRAGPASSTAGRPRRASSTATDSSPPSPTTPAPCRPSSASTPAAGSSTTSPAPPGSARCTACRDCNVPDRDAKTVSVRNQFTDGQVARTASSKACGGATAARRPTPDHPRGEPRPARRSRLVLRPQSAAP